MNLNFQSAMDKLESVSAARLTTGGLEAGADQARGAMANPERQIGQMVGGAFQLVGGVGALMKTSPSSAVAAAEGLGKI